MQEAHIPKSRSSGTDLITDCETEESHNEIIEAHISSVINCTILYFVAHTEKFNILKYFGVNDWMEHR
jgi:hypothetical protein